MDSLIKENLLQIQEDIAPCKSNIIAVTKYFEVQKMLDAYDTGLRDFAEARVNDAIVKINSLPDYVRENSKFHFIGHLQTNKVGKVVKFFDFIHSVDSLNLAEKISKTALEQNKVQKVFIEVNFAQDDNKFGYSEDLLYKEFPFIKELEGLEILGLMSMAPLGAEENFLYSLYSKVVSVQKDLSEKYSLPMKETSMGMSQDYIIAAKCGSTQLRIGRKLFT
ncbi:YggS family pyridoxal phosphate-dependent enzyme [bacterium]|nr:YggS family pyridoxal phosphate-dependent enzyme [bacterium]